MYFFRLGKLTNDLKKNLIDQNGAIKYLIGFLIITLISSGNSKLGKIIQSINPKDLGLVISLVFAVLGIAIFVIDFLYSYKINKSGDNKNFLVRYLSLSFVIGMYNLVFFEIPLNIFVAIFGRNLIPQPGEKVVQLGEKVNMGSILPQGSTIRHEAIVVEDPVTNWIRIGIAALFLLSAIFFLLIKFYQWKKIAAYTRNQNQPND